MSVRTKEQHQGELRLIYQQALELHDLVRGLRSNIPLGAFMYPRLRAMEGQLLDLRHDAWYLGLFLEQHGYGEVKIGNPPAPAGADRCADPECGCNLAAAPQRRD